MMILKYPNSVSIIVQSTSGFIKGRKGSVHSGYM